MDSPHSAELPREVEDIIEKLTERKVKLVQVQKKNIVMLTARGRGVIVSLPWRYLSPLLRALTSKGYVGTEACFMNKKVVFTFEMKAGKRR